MASGQAQRAHEETGRRVVIVGKDSRPRWHEAWEHNPAIARKPGPDTVTVTNGPGCRPYIAYPWNGRQKFTGWRARDHVGRICLTEAEQAFAGTVEGPFLLIEPHVKKRGQPNKDWGFARYQALVDSLPGTVFVQPVHDGGRILRGARAVETPTFRHAAALLGASCGYVGVEGAMHHAAAALGKPAVVLVGSAVPVDLICYPEHHNMAHGEPCGSWTPCRHCRENMDAITVEAVADAMRAIWRP